MNTTPQTPPVEDEEITFPDAKAEMVRAFPGTDVMLQHGIGVVTVSTTFDEYDLRVMISGKKGSGTRVTQVRFLQRIPPSTKRVIYEMRVTTMAEYSDAISWCRGYLQGLCHAIQTALKPKVVHQINGVADIFGGDD